jgi:hypothetical protein
MSTNFNDWGVFWNSDNNMGINMSDIFLPDATAPTKEIQIQLRGDPVTDFLPAGEGDITNHELDIYVVWGKPKVGPGRSWDTCYQSGDNSSFTLPPSQLIIERISE